MSGQLKYRPDIDGIRAIAVSIVVLFHAGLPHFDGGFIGVDIFFVISGFLITSLLVKEVEATGTISVSNFYARRVRRLMPAGLFVIITVLLIGFFLYPADGDRQALSHSAIAATLFISNFYFWRTTGYFQASAEDTPLLHTWTLSVEEQFYVFWPLLILIVLWGARRFRLDFRLCLLVSFSAVCLVSFALAQWMLSTRPSAAFYLVIARSFELGAGAVLALYTARLGGNDNQWGKLGGVLSIVGVVAIIFAVLGFNGTTPWPGPLSLIVVAATLALLAGGRMAPQSGVSRLLSILPMVFIGKISYSWYLWHWPFLVFLHYAQFGLVQISQKLIALTASLLVAIFSYYIVEQPIRHAKSGLFSSIKGSLVGGLLMIFAVSALGVGFYAHADKELKGSPKLLASVVAKKRVNLVHVNCSHFQAQFTNIAPWNDCLIRSQSSAMQTKVVVMGDSHALVMQPAFKYLAENKDIEFALRTKAGCRPFRGKYMLVVPETPAIRRACEGFYAAVMSELGELKSEGYEQLWLISRWPPAGTPDAVPSLWKDEFSKTVQMAKQAGLEVVIFSGPPQFEHAVPRCVSRLSSAECALTRVKADIIQNQQMQVLSAIAEREEVEVFDVFNELCDASNCFVSKSGAVLYKDNNHLSIDGALTIGHAISVRLPRRMSEGP